MSCQQDIDQHQHCQVIDPHQPDIDPYQQDIDQHKQVVGPLVLQPLPLSVGCSSLCHLSYHRHKGDSSELSIPRN